MKKVILMVVVASMIGIIGCRKSPEVIIEETEVQYEIIHPGDFVEEENFVYVVIDDQSVKVVKVKYGAIDANGVVNVPEKTTGDTVVVNGQKVFMKGGRAVITMASEVLKGNVDIKEMRMPSVKTVESKAFLGCLALTSVSLPVAKILERNAFQGCSALLKVSIQEVETIEDSVFFDCKALTLVDMIKVKTIGIQAFMKCSALSSVSMPVVEVIGNHSFAFCAVMTTLDIPLIKRIDDLAFRACSRLVNVNMPSTGCCFTSRSFMGCLWQPGKNGVSSYCP